MTDGVDLLSKGELAIKVTPRLWVKCENVISEWRIWLGPRSHPHLTFYWQNLQLDRTLRYWLALLMLQSPTFVKLTMLHCPWLNSGCWLLALTDLNLLAVNHQPLTYDHWNATAKPFHDQPSTAWLRLSGCSRLCLRRLQRHWRLYLEPLAAAGANSSCGWLLGGQNLKLMAVKWKRMRRINNTI